MMFALNQMYWLDGVFLWTNRTSFNINVLWTNRTSFNINVSEIKSFNKTIDFWCQVDTIFINPRSDNHLGRWLR